MHACQEQSIVVHLKLQNSNFAGEMTMATSWTWAAAMKFHVMGVGWNAVRPSRRPPLLQQSGEEDQLWVIAPACQSKIG
jgi:hypothetical protein